jgi:hypothetical protein
MTAIFRFQDLLNRKQLLVWGENALLLILDLWGETLPQRPLSSASPLFPTSAGNVTVKVEPFPYSLVTARSPPINWQNLRLMAKPRPVPPNFACVPASAWVNAWNSLPKCSLVIPIPVLVSLNSMPCVVDDAPSLSNSSCEGPPASRRRTASLIALLGELASVAQEVEQGLPDLGLTGAHSSDVRGAVEQEGVRPFRDQGPQGRQHIVQ